MNLTKQLVFIKNLNKAVKSGLPLDNFFNRLAKNTMWPAKKKLYSQLSKDIADGSTITDALSKHKNLLEEMYILLIGVGEKSGKLDEILHNITDILQNRIALRRKIFTELRQPVFNIGGALVVFSIIVFGLIPKLTEFLSANLCCPPLIVRVISGIKDTVFNIEFLYFIVLVAFLLAAIEFFRSEIEDVDEFIGYKILKLPVIGDVIRWYELYVYFLVLKDCYTSGLSIFESTEYAKTTLKNTYLKVIASEIQKKTGNGEPVSTILPEYTENNIFEPEIPELVEIGEATGRTDEAYNNVNLLLREFIDARIERICSVTFIIGIILAAAPIVIIILIVLSILSQAMSKISGIGL